MTLSVGVKVDVTLIVGVLVRVTLFVGVKVDVKLIVGVLVRVTLFVGVRLGVCEKLGKTLLQMSPHELLDLVHMLTVLA